MCFPRIEGIREGRAVVGWQTGGPLPRPSEDREDARMPVQDAKGRFTLGNGGPGFPVRLRTVRDMVLSQTRDGQDMIEMLVRIVKDPAIKNDPSAVTAIHLAACAKLLDYGFGKPKEQLEVDLTATYRAMSDAELREVLTQKLIAYAQPGALPE